MRNDSRRAEGYCFVDVYSGVAPFNEAANELVCKMCVSATMAARLAQFRRKQVPMILLPPFLNVIRHVGDERLARPFGIQVGFQRAIEGVSHHGSGSEITELTNLRHMPFRCLEKRYLVGEWVVFIRILLQDRVVLPPSQTSCLRQSLTGYGDHSGR